MQKKMGTDLSLDFDILSRKINPVQKVVEAKLPSGNSDVCTDEEAKSPKKNKEIDIGFGSPN